MRILRESWLRKSMTRRRPRLAYSFYRSRRISLRKGGRIQSTLLRYSHSLRT